MFGYLKINRNEISQEDTIIYNSYYCSICKSLKKYGFFSRFLTNYDITFIYLVLSSRLDDCDKFSLERCIKHPLIKRKVLISNSLSDVIVCTNIFLCYYKYMDDLLDTDNSRIKIYDKLLKKIYFEKAKKRYPYMQEIVKEKYYYFVSIENSNYDFDTISGAFGGLIVAIVREIMGKNSDDKTLSLFYYLGKWIYLIDAIDDLEKDFNNNCFNPFTKDYSKYGNKIEFIKHYENDIWNIIIQLRTKILRAFDESDIIKNRTIINNILLHGIRLTSKKILKKY